MNRDVVIFCVLGIVSCTLCSCTKTKTTQKVGQHNVEINGRAAKAQRQ